MSPRELVTLIVNQNPHIDSSRVSEYLRYVERLRNLGARIEPRYGVTHPFESNRMGAASRVLLHGDNRPE